MNLSVAHTLYSSMLRNPFHGKQLRFWVGKSTWDMTCTPENCPDFEIVFWHNLGNERKSRYESKKVYGREGYQDIVGGRSFAGTREEGGPKMLCRRCKSQPIDIQYNQVRGYNKHYDLWRLLRRRVSEKARCENH